MKIRAASDVVHSIAEVDMIHVRRVLMNRNGAKHRTIVAILRCRRNVRTLCRAHCLHLLKPASPGVGVSDCQTVVAVLALCYAAQAY